MQCACNALLAVCWTKFCKVSCWNNFDLDFVLDLGDNLFKGLGIHRYLDASDLPEHIRFHGNSWTINKTYLHDEEAIIGTRFLFNPFLPCSRSAPLLFINSTVKAIKLFLILVHTIYLTHIVEKVEVSQLPMGHQFCSNFLVSNRYVENYIEVIYLEYQGRERQYFQLQFLEIEVENLDESCQNINRVMKQVCRNSAYSKRKEQVTGLQRQPQKILKMKKHGDVKINIKVDTKVKQLMTSQKLKN